jgi:hypothetical protein
MIQSLPRSHRPHSRQCSCANSLARGRAPAVVMPAFFESMPAIGGKSVCSSKCRRSRPKPLRRHHLAPCSFRNAEKCESHITSNGDSDVIVRGSKPCNIVFPSRFVVEGNRCGDIRRHWGEAITFPHGYAPAQRLPCFVRNLCSTGSVVGMLQTASIPGERPLHFARVANTITGDVSEAEFCAGYRYSAYSTCSTKRPFVGIRFCDIGQNPNPSRHSCKVLQPLPNLPQQSQRYVRHIHSAPPSLRPSQTAANGESGDGGKPLPDLLHNGGGGA